MPKVADIKRQQLNHRGTVDIPSILYVNIRAIGGLTIK